MRARSCRERLSAGPVKTSLRAVEYRWLAGLAKEHHTTVESLVAELTRQAYVARAVGVPHMQRVKHRRITERDRAVIRDLYVRGFSFLQIAAVSKCGPQSIANQCAAMGLAPQYKGRVRKGQAA